MQLSGEIPFPGKQGPPEPHSPHLYAQGQQPAPPMAPAGYQPPSPEYHPLTPEMSVDDPTPVVSPNIPATSVTPVINVSESEEDTEEDTSMGSV